MKYLLLLPLLYLVGCADNKLPPPNDVLIKENKQCVDAGMTPVILFDNGWTMNTVAITCIPKDK